MAKPAPALIEQRRAARRRGRSPAERSSLGLYRLALERLPVAVILARRDLTPLIANAPARAIFASTLGDLSSAEPLKRLLGGHRLEQVAALEPGETCNLVIPVPDGHPGSGVWLVQAAALPPGSWDPSGALQLTLRAASDSARAFSRVELQLEPLSGGQDKETLYHEALTALAELQVAEEELRVQNDALTAAHGQIDRERARYQDLFEAAPDGYLVTDLAGVILEANREAAALLNVQPYFLPGKPLAVFVASQSLKDFRRRVAEFEVSGRIQDWELLLQPRHAPIFPVSLSVAAEPGRGRPGQPPAALRWQLRDIRARKAAELSLKKAKAGLEQQVAERTAELEARNAGLAEANIRLADQDRKISDILESIADGFFAIGRDWRFTYLNRRAAAVGGYEPQDLLGADIWEAFPELLGTPTETHYRKVMETRAPSSFEVRAITAERWYAVSVYPSADGISIYWQDITARKRLEAESEAHRAALEALTVQHAEARLQAEQMAVLNQLRTVETEAIFDAIADGVVVYNAAGRAVRANPAAVNLAGFDPTGNTLQETGARLNARLSTGQAVAPEQLPGARGLRGLRLSGERFLFTNAAGEELAVLASASPLRGLDGRVNGAVVVWHDVTSLERAASLQQRLVEENLRQRDLLERLVQTAPVGIALVSGPEHRFTLTNPAFLALAGEARDLVGGTVAELWPGVAGQAIPWLEAVRRTGQPFHADDLLMVFDRGRGVEQLTFTLTLTPLRASSGEVESILALVEETTAQVLARQQAEAAHQQAEAAHRRLLAVIENAPEGIVVADEDGRQALANPAAERLYRHPALEDAAGAPGAVNASGEVSASGAAPAGPQVCYPDGSPVPPDDLPLARSALEGVSLAEVELALRWPDGQARPVLASTAPIRAAGGELTGAVGIFQDLSERKRREQHANFLSELGRSLLALQPSGAVLPRVAQQVGAYLGVDGCWIAEPSPASGEAPAAGEWGLPASQALVAALDLNTAAGEAHAANPGLINPWLEQFPGWAGEVLFAGQPVTVDDLALDPRTAAAYERSSPRLALRSLVAVPQRDTNGRWTGWLAAASRAPRRWSGDELELLRAAADLAWLGLENARLYERLRAAEERFRLALQNAPIFVAAHDRGLRYTWAYNSLGLGLDQLLGKRDDELLPPPEAAGLLAFKQAVLDSGRTRRSELTVRGAAGDLHTYDITAEPLFDAQGQVQGLTFAAYEITERKALENRLAYEALVLENVHDAVMATDAGLRLTTWNRAAEELYGWKAEEVIGRVVYEVIRSQDFDARARQQALETLNAGRAYRADLVQFRRDGSRIDVEGTTVPLCDASGQITGYIGTSFDITDRKRAEGELIERTEALRRSEAAERARAAELQALMDAAPVVVLTAHDPQCRLVTGNPAAYRLFNLPEGTNLTATPDPAGPGGVVHLLEVDGESPGAARLPLQTAAASGIPVQDVRQRLTLPDGRVVHLYGNVAPLLDEEGRPRGALAAYTDITRLVEAERVLEEYTARLEASHRELKDFAFIASHDLQEPLRKVQAFGERLAREHADQLGPDGQEHLRRMLNANDRMQEMLTGLLNYSRVTTRGHAFERVDLNQVAAEVLNDLEVRLERSGGQVEVGELPVVTADPLQMRQLLQNLLSNALKFYRRGGTPQVKVYARAIEAPEKNVLRPPGAGPFIELCVEDNGIGIDPAQAGRMFQPFQRLVGRSEFEGSGIGLAICRKIVERHGGQIAATGIPGQGTTVMVRLPAWQG